MARFVALICLVVFMNLSAATHDVQVGPNLTFIPSALIINLGDSVRWTNAGGFHNVVEVSIPPVFSSGPPSSSPWVYSFEFNDPSVFAYVYVCEVHAEQGMVGGISVLPVSAGERPVPAQFSLGEAFPNPFNSLAHIDLNLPAATSVRLEIYNSLGQRMGTLFDGYAVAGAHRFAINGADWASGIYFVRAVTPGQSAYRKIVLLK